VHARWGEGGHWGPRGAASQGGGSERLNIYEVLSGS
jgi:hypothetical protein